MKFGRYIQVLLILALIGILSHSQAAAEDGIIDLPVPFSYLDQEGALNLFGPEGGTESLYAEHEIIDYAWFNDGIHVLILIQENAEKKLIGFSLESDQITEYSSQNLELSNYQHLSLGDLSQDDQKASLAYGNCLGVFHLASGETEEISCFAPIEDQEGNQLTSGVTYLDPVFNSANDEIITASAADETAQIILFPLLGDTAESEPLGCCFYPQIADDGLSLFAYANRDLAPDVFADEETGEQGIVQYSLVDNSVLAFWQTEILKSLQLFPGSELALLESIDPADGSSAIHLLSVSSGEEILLVNGHNPKWQPDTASTEPETPGEENPAEQVPETEQTPTPTPQMDSTYEPVTPTAEPDVDLNELLTEHFRYLNDLSTVTYQSAVDQTTTQMDFLAPEAHLEFSEDIHNSIMNDAELAEALYRLTLQDEINYSLVQEYAQVNTYAVEVELTISSLLRELNRSYEKLYGSGSRISEYGALMTTSFSGRWASSVSSLDLRFAMQQGILGTMAIEDKAVSRKILAQMNFDALASLLQESYLESYEHILSSNGADLYSGTAEDLELRMAEIHSVISQTRVNADQGGIGSINLNKIKEMTTLLQNLDTEDSAAAFEDLTAVLLELRLVLNAVSEENVQGEALDCLATIAAETTGHVFAPDQNEITLCSTEPSSLNWVDGASWNLLRPWWKEKMEDYLLVLSATSKEITRTGSPLQMALLLGNFQASGYDLSPLLQEEITDPLEDLNQSQEALNTATHMAFLLLTPPDGFLPSVDSAYLLEKIFIHDHLVMEYNLGVQAYLSSPDVGDKVIQTQIKDISAEIETNVQEMIDFIATADFSSEVSLTGPQINSYPEDISGTTGFVVPVEIIVRNIGSEPIHGAMLQIYAGESLLAQKQYDRIVYGQEISTTLNITLPAPEYEHLVLVFTDHQRYDMLQMPVDIRNPLLDEQGIAILNTVCPGMFMVLAALFALSILGLGVVGILTLVTRLRQPKPRSEQTPTEG